MGIAYLFSRSRDYASCHCHESYTMYVTLSSTTWHSALHTPAFVYLPTAWVHAQSVSFGTLVGLQISTEQELLNNTT